MTALLPSSPRIGIVLGAGGPVGHAYHCGVLRALQHALHWDPRHAVLLVGTSAGAQVAALLRAGMDAADLMARVVKKPLSAAGAALARHFHRPDRRTPHPDNPRSLWPAAPGYLVRALRRPWSARPARLLSALLPRGRACMRQEAEGYNRLFPDGWPVHRMWIPAVHLASGRLVVFGREDAPRVDVGAAVTSSGAVPMVCAPIQIDGEPYVDGGLASGVNLDVLGNEPLDLVIASHPLGHMPTMSRRFGREVEALRRRGHRVVDLEPRGEVRDRMGLNPMDTARGPAVAEAAYEATLRDIESAGRRRLFEGVL